MTKKQKKVLWRIIATAVLVAVVKIFSIGGVAGTVLYLRGISMRGMRRSITPRLIIALETART